jgi:hypothetical protein
MQDIYTSILKNMFTCKFNEVVRNNVYWNTELNEYIVYFIFYEYFLYVIICIYFMRLLFMNILYILFCAIPACVYQL